MYASKYFKMVNQLVSNMLKLAAKYSKYYNEMMSILRLKRLGFYITLI